MRIFANANYNFIRWRWHALILSLVLIWAGVATIFLKGGIPLGIEFTGGTALVLKFNQPTGEDVVRKALDTVSKEAAVQQYGPPSDHQIFVRLPMIPGHEQGAELDADSKKVEDALHAAGLQPEISKDIVGPVMGKDYQSKGIWATVAALGGILIYVAFRFRFTFALGAIVAAFHDILITLVFLTWFGYDLSLNIIAGLLTITGYSVNDTIVVFDRVRENRGKYGHLSKRIINDSINQTLSRTLLTGGTNMMTVFVMYVMGGPGIHGFTFVLLTGILVGTYSSVAIAAPLLLIGKDVDNKSDQAGPTGGQTKEEARKALASAGQLQRA
jgi:preprotein translocase subunit SecF